MPKQTSSNFLLNINPYDGDPETIQFFCEQVSDIININKFSDEQSLAYIKSKLTGAALKYYLESPKLKSIKQYPILLDELTKFFSTKTNSFAIQSLESLAMMPNETIKNLSHRLNVLVDKVYPNITDSTAINNIKYVKFLATIPIEIKIKILEQGITSYEGAVERAQTLQEISSERELTNQSQSLQEEINMLKKTLAEAVRPAPRDTRNEAKNTVGDHLTHPYKSEQPVASFRDHHPQFPTPRPRCHYCGKVGHIMRECFLYKRENHSRNHLNYRPMSSLNLRNQRLGQGYFKRNVSQGSKYYQNAQQKHLN